MNSKAIVFAILGAGLLIAATIFTTQSASVLPRFLDPYDEIKQVIEVSLYDPSSVQYKNWEEDYNSYCVEINAKNRYGAYTGFKKIHVWKKPMNQDITDNSEVVAIMCKPQ